jgi:hypothetical protein
MASKTWLQVRLLFRPQTGLFRRRLYTFWIPYGDFSDFCWASLSRCAFYGVLRCSEDASRPRKLSELVPTEERRVTKFGGVPQITMWRCGFGVVPQIMCLRPLDRSTLFLRMIRMTFHLGVSRWVLAPFSGGFSFEY